MAKERALFDFTVAVEEVIEECRRTGAYSKVQRFDGSGEVILWLEANWTQLPDDMEVVELYICYSDTGRVAYSKLINETKRILSS